MRRRLAPAALLLAAALAAPGARAAAQDTLALPALHDAALSRDPRTAQYALRRAATELRLRNLAAERLPQFSLRADATYQSDVTTIPLDLPGATPPEPPRDRYTAAVDVQQLVYDGGALRGRRAVEVARLAEQEAEVRTAIRGVRDEVDEAFFAAFLLQARAAEVALLVEDLEARLTLVRARWREGAALPGDTAAIRAELLRAGQTRDELAADRRAALQVLGALVGRDVGEGDVLALPALGDDVARARAQGGADGVFARPEHERFARTRERLSREAELLSAQRRPRVEAFGQAGVGRPGPFLLFDDGVNDFWQVGVRAQWTPWSWGTTRREREALEIQRRVVETEQAAFTERLGRLVQDDLAAMGRLEAALGTDDRIVALREQVERQARAQLDERAITPDEYVDARTDLLEARVARERHRAELARARARYLATLGVEIR